MKLMNKPAHIKVGAIQYHIEYVPDLRDGDKKLDGHVRHSETKISVDARLSSQSGVQTLLHEIVHVVATQMGKQELDENIVDAIAYAVYQVLRDNPDLVKTIMRQEPT